MVITMKSALNFLIESNLGTAKEMQIRFVLHEIRKAADNGEKEVCIPVYKISKLHLPTLRFEGLKLSGFDSGEFESEEIKGQKMLRISW